MTAPASRQTMPDNSAIRCARRMVDVALDRRNVREFYRHAGHLKALKAAARRRLAARQAGGAS